MKITQISFRRTVNLGNYQSKTLEVTAEVGEDEIPQFAIWDLEDFVLEQLGELKPNRQSPPKKKEEDEQKPTNTDSETEELNLTPF
jgi:hypothetical protein